MSTNYDDTVQHGIDDNANNDAEKGAALGGLGGVAVGAAAGSLLGPVGTVVGAVAGGLLGAGASGAAVAAIDQVDNDNTVSGVGETTTTDLSGTTYDPNLDTTYPNTSAVYDPITNTNNLSATPSAEISGHNIVTGEPATSDAGTTGLATGAVVGGLVGTVVGGPVGAAVGGTLGSLAGGVAGDAAEAADAEGGEYIGTPYDRPLNNPTGDPSLAADHDVTAQNPNTFRNDENIGVNNFGASDLNSDTTNIGGIDTTSGYRTNGVTDGIGNDVPGVQTGGITTEGSDTRGITEKAADAVTGDRTDDKTGGRVL